MKSVTKLLKKFLPASKIEALIKIREKTAAIRVKMARLLGLPYLLLYIDVAHCNLACALCPKGEAAALKNPYKD